MKKVNNDHSEANSILNKASWKMLLSVIVILCGWVLWPSNVANISGPAAQETFNVEWGDREWQVFHSHCEDKFNMTVNKEKAHIDQKQYCSCLSDIMIAEQIAPNDVKKIVDQYKDETMHCLARSVVKP